MLTSTTGKTALDKVFHAAVDIETGMLWWKKTRTEQVQREYAGFWFFVTTGKWAPNDVAALARAWTARTGEET
jgi:hypothetical protein